METLYRHSEKVAVLSKDASITADTDFIKASAAGVDPAKARADHKAAKAAARSPDRSGTAATLLKLPQHFREQ